MKKHNCAKGIRFILGRRCLAMLMASLFLTQTTVSQTLDSTDYKRQKLKEWVLGIGEAALSELDEGELDRSIELLDELSECQAAIDEMNWGKDKAFVTLVIATALTGGGMLGLMPHYGASTKRITWTGLAFLIAEAIIVTTQAVTTRSPIEDATVTKWTNRAEENRRLIVASALLTEKVSGMTSLNLGTPDPDALPSFEIVEGGNELSLSSDGESKMIRIGTGYLKAEHRKLNKELSVLQQRFKDSCR